MDQIDFHNYFLDTYRYKPLTFPILHEEEDAVKKHQ